ncbi:hypothetical protein EDD11_008505 [Mortierella claussenii]|nr:hypothetical protein EDD11_008505 [Mortierella claussenii]
MGISNLYQTLKKNSMFAVPYSTQSLGASVVHIDLLGSFWSRIVPEMALVDNPLTIRQAGSVMAEILVTHFDVEHSVVHIDGLPYVEKQAEHHDRGLKRAKEFEKTESGINKMTALSQARKWAP